MSEDQRRSRTPKDAAHRVAVLGAFTLTAPTGPVALGADARRLVAYLAVHPRPQRRDALAADLWPGLAAPAARRLLDDAVAALDVPGLLDEAADGTLALAAGVAVDLTEALALVRGLPALPGTSDVDLGLLDADILPGWTAGWIAVERERFRQLRLHALEERSARLSAAGRHDEAVAVARRAVRTAPSRESARRAVVTALLARGDIAGALDEQDAYQELLRSSVGAAATTGSLLAPAPAWPVVRTRPAMPRSAVQLPGLRSVRTTGGRRLVAGGSSRH
jgi:DNA-binding SARP family transcriptional activator